MLTTFELVEMLMDDAIDANEDSYQKHVEHWIGPTLVYSLIWGVGGILDSESRIRFDHLIKEVGIRFLNESACVIIIVNL